MFFTLSACITLNFCKDSFICSTILRGANTAESGFLAKKQTYLMVLPITKSAMEQSGIDYKSKICSYRIKDTISNKYIISFHKSQHLFYKYTDDDRWRFGGLAHLGTLSDGWALATD